MQKEQNKARQGSTSSRTQGERESMSLHNGMEKDYFVKAEWILYIHIVSAINKTYAPLRLEFAARNALFHIIHMPHVRWLSIIICIEKRQGRLSELQLACLQG